MDPWIGEPGLAVGGAPINWALGLTAEPPIVPIRTARHSCRGD